MFTCADGLIKKNCVTCWEMFHDRPVLKLRLPSSSQSDTAEEEEAAPVEEPAPKKRKCKLRSSKN